MCNNSTWSATAYIKHCRLILCVLLVGQRKRDGIKTNRWAKKNNPTKWHQHDAAHAANRRDMIEIAIKKKPEKEELSHHNSLLTCKMNHLFD